MKIRKLLLVITASCLTLGGMGLAEAKSKEESESAAKAKPDAESAVSKAKSTKSKADTDEASAKSKADAEAPSAAWFDLSSHESPISFDYWMGNESHVASVFFSPTPADEILYYNDNLTPQDPISIRGYIDTQLFGVGSHTLTYVSGCDEPTSHCTNATASGQNGDFSNIFWSTKPFNFLAVHFGQGELVFQWSSQITSFEIGGLPRGLSNYRAYTDQPPPAVPESETYAMLIAGLGLLSFTARCRKQSA